ncbi:MAG TPA: serine hydrolase domain-containing protein, partial [Nitrososphaera sp.]|nr:serine hydrolase domain-containing protein [Nitrososphaera sp.]
MKFVAFVLLTLAVKAQAQPPLSRQLDSLMNAFVANTFFSGVVVVADRDSTLYQRAFGLADRERNVPVAMTTRFNIASIGKTFTAVLIMQLVEEGRLDLHTPIQAYLSDSIPNADRITIHHLLTHTSGLSNYMTHPDYQNVRSRLRSLSDVMKLVSDMPLAFSSPGERFEYSNSGYIVLGRIIEQVTGKDYVTYVREKLWQPLGMNGTSIAYPAIIRPPSEAIPYYVFSEQSYVSAIADENPAFSDGGVFSNALDMLTFARALLSNRLLKRQTIELMFTPYSRMSPAWQYGYGWSVSGDHFGKRVVGHSGGGLGYSNDLRILLDDGRIVIVQANLRTSPRKVTESII